MGEYTGSEFSSVIGRKKNDVRLGRERRVGKRGLPGRERQPPEVQQERVRGG